MVDSGFPLGTDADGRWRFNCRQRCTGLRQQTDAVTGYSREHMSHRRRFASVGASCRATWCSRPRIFERIRPEAQHVPVGVGDLHLARPWKTLRRMEDRGTLRLELFVQGLNVADANPHPGSRLALVALGQVDSRVTRFATT